MRYLFLAILPFFALLFCSCATPYQAADMDGGYSEIRQPYGTYIVEFQGNGYTSKEVVSKYLIRRCAELTVQKGYRYFQIIDRNSKDGVDYHFEGKNSFSLSKYVERAEIKFLPQKPPTPSESIYDARLYLKTNSD
jgi:hypothetical protein